MKKIAIIGASYLQLPLIEKAKKMGYETHVFAWKVGDVGEEVADYFYPISIVEKEQILEECLKIGVSGICSIASDLAMVTVNYVAQKMNLIGNTIESTKKSTNKYLMRNSLLEAGVPCPRYILSDDIHDYTDIGLEFPVIVKPTDRSGSRGVTKLKDKNGLSQAITGARDVSFEKKAIIEEYVGGKEYSVECISCNGVHQLLAITEKYTTGSPNYIETGHFEPAILADHIVHKVNDIVFCSLDALEVKNGASHSELKIDEKGNIKIIEIGARMGGDLIGSSLVELTTGFDFVGNVISVAMGDGLLIKNDSDKYKAAGVCFIFDNYDIQKYKTISNDNPEMIKECNIEEISDRIVTDSSSRFGYYVVAGNDVEKVHYYVDYACEKKGEDEF